MSMPNVPAITPEITITKDDAVNIILSSIGMEELGLAHLLNAEAEKIQFALGTLDTAKEAASLDDILEVNKQASKMVRNVIKNQMLLSMKMEDTIDYAMALSTTTVDEPVKEESTEEAVKEA
ncbi:MAG: hypothetical protein R3Y47_00185 [Lachnospiraceae bacterium]